MCRIEYFLFSSAVGFLALCLLRSYEMPSETSGEEKYRKKIPKIFFCCFPLSHVVVQIFLMYFPLFAGLVFSLWCFGALPWKTISEFSLVPALARIAENFFFTLASFLFRKSTHESGSMCAVGIVCADILDWCVAYVTRWLCCFARRKKLPWSLHSYLIITLRCKHVEFHSKLARIHFLWK